MRSEYQRLESYESRGGRSVIHVGRRVKAEGDSGRVWERSEGTESGTETRNSVNTKDEDLLTPVGNQGVPKRLPRLM